MPLNISVVNKVAQKLHPAHSLSQSSQWLRVHLKFFFIFITVMRFLSIIHVALSSFSLFPWSVLAVVWCVLSKSWLSDVLVRSPFFYAINFVFLSFYLLWVYYVILFLTFFFYCSGFCHTLKWISHVFTCVPHPDPPSHIPLHPIPLGLPSAPGPSTCLMYPTWAGDLFHPR